METDKKIIELLRERVEQVCERRMATPRDFSWLSERLFTDLGVRLSATTLKRLWGYLDESTTPRQFTLDTLSRLLGYSDLRHFAAQATTDGESPSNPVMGTQLRSEALADNGRVRLSWAPGRVCVVRYLGNGRFVVESSERTRLQAGDTFDCSLIIEGEPMYLADLVQQGRRPTAYVCGKRGGIHFTLLDD